MADEKEKSERRSPHLATYGSAICFPWRQEMIAATNGDYSRPIAPVHPIKPPYPPALSFVLRFSSAASQSQRPSNSSSNTAAGKRREKGELREAGDKKEKQSNRRSSPSARQPSTTISPTACPRIEAAIATTTRIHRLRLRMFREQGLGQK